MKELYPKAQASSRHLQPQQPSHFTSTPPQVRPEISVSISFSTMHDLGELLITQLQNLWLEHMMLWGDGFSDPPNIRVRPLEGINAVNYLDPGTFVRVRYHMLQHEQAVHLTPFCHRKPRMSLGQSSKLSRMWDTQKIIWKPPPTIGDAHRFISSSKSLSSSAIKTLAEYSTFYWCEQTR